MVLERITNKVTEILIEHPRKAFTALNVTILVIVLAILAKVGILQEASRALCQKCQAHTQITAGMIVGISLCSAVALALWIVSRRLKRLFVQNDPPRINFE